MKFRRRRKKKTIIGYI